MPGSDYDPFAWLYNIHWSGAFVEAILPGLDRYIFDNLPPESKVLDLGCGTGQLAAILHKRGFQVTGVDNSEGMLAIARENAPGVELIFSDAADFQMPAEFSAVVSTYDTLNHLMDRKALRAAFANVHAALIAGGRFMFDVNMADGYRARWAGTFTLEREDHFAVTRSSFNEDEMLGVVEIVLFQQADDLWRRSDMVLQQRCYSEGEIVGALEEAGFEAPLVLDAVEDLGLRTQVGRSFFLCKKHLA